MELQDIKYEEIDFGEAVGYHFVKVPDLKYENLAEEDSIIILEKSVNTDFSFELSIDFKEKQ